MENTMDPSISSTPCRLVIIQCHALLVYYCFLKFTQSFISWLVIVVGRRWVAIWNPLIKLYRIVAISRPNIDVLPINSTKASPRKRAARSKSSSNFRTFRKRGRVDDTATTTTVTTVKTNVAKHSHSSASLRSPSRNTLLDNQRHHDWLVGRRSPKAPALISDVMMC
eukprot:scaffold10418_cov149-Skeletonema_dohrnii-CCMP3373.AAC.1